jgi:hypothetical protein
VDVIKMYDTCKENEIWKHYIGGEELPEKREA